MGREKQQRTLSSGEVGFIWVNAKGTPVAGMFFNPFTNPSDCARVKAYAQSQGYEWTIRNRDNFVTVRLGKVERSLPLLGATKIRRGFGGAQEEEEAFCNALLEAIGGER